MPPFPQFAFKIILLAGLTSVLGACHSIHHANENSINVPINRVSANGIGLNIGTITLSQSHRGLIIHPKLSSLPPGAHGFHIHMNPSCDAANNPEGIMTSAQTAGGHLDVQKTGKHLGPMAHGHNGDLPILQVAADGTATTTLLAPNLNLADVRNRAIMIHAGGDNYSDQPAALGGGGARIACGVISSS